MQIVLYNKYKVRLVVKGYAQVFGVDFSEISRYLSPSLCSWYLDI